MKRFLVVISVVVAMISGLSVLAEGEMNLKALEQTVMSDNVSIDEQSLVMSYTLEELNEYFFFSPFNPVMWFDTTLLRVQHDPKDRLWENIDERFPIEFTRRFDKKVGEEIYDEGYYSVFRVKEGGRFYLFWEIEEEGPIARYAVYIDKLKEQEEFDGIVGNVSTYADVCAIDPENIYSELPSSGPVSCTLLSGGRMMIIRYHHMQRREEWNESMIYHRIVAEKVVCDTPLSESIFQYIKIEDLP